MEDKLNRLAELFDSASKRMTYNQKNAAKNIIEILLNDMNKLKAENEIFVAKLAGCTNYDEYSTNLDKLIVIIRLLDFDLPELQLMHSEETMFIRLHQYELKKSGEMTPKRLKNLIRLIRYFRQTEFRYPNSVNELKSKHAELKQLREQD